MSESLWIKLNVLWIGGVLVFAFILLVALYVLSKMGKALVVYDRKEEEE